MSDITATDLLAYRRDLAANCPASECCTGECNQGRLCPQRWPAEAATDIGADPKGQRRTGWLTRAWLRLVRVLG